MLFFQLLQADQTRGGKTCVALVASIPTSVLQASRPAVAFTCGEAAANRASSSNKGSISCEKQKSRALATSEPPHLRNAAAAVASSTPISTKTPTAPALNGTTDRCELLSLVHIPPACSNDWLASRRALLSGLDARSRSAAVGPEVDHTPWTAGFVAV